ncbi:MAG TPA: cation diffusion facilitator family transporter [Acidimicrobiales bacterium]|nr:cation diffusion facilitator family transporter [Acidimicrobiales bacterium]
MPAHDDDHPDDHDHPDGHAGHDHHHAAHDHHQAGHDDHHHGGGGGRLRRLLGLEAPHSHDAADRVDTALESSALGIRAVKLSLLGLGATATLQAVVVVFTGSVALLGDTLHNFADALTALPLWLAFAVSQRPRNRRYTHGYGRSEDLAGLFIVLVIAASSMVAGWESVVRLLHPTEVHHLAVVMIASVLGFAGNEAVAQYRIKVGRRIGSAALVADGMHARTDGLTSLAVLLGAIGVAVGWRAADAVIGLVITLAILVVLRSAVRDVYRRLMDAVDPELVDRAEAVVRGVAGVEGVDDLRIRWIGHRLRAEVDLLVDAGLTVVEGHRIADRAYHALLHDVPRLATAVVHVSPASADGTDHHAEISHHLTAGE